MEAVTVVVDAGAAGAVVVVDVPATYVIGKN